MEKTKARPKRRAKDTAFTRAVRRSNDAVRSAMHASCFLGPSFLGVALFFIIPFGVVVYYSLIQGPMNHSFVGLANYESVIANGAFQTAVRNTLVFTGVAVPLAVVLSLVLALMLECRIPLKSQFRTFFLSPMVVPIASIILVWQCCSTPTAWSTNFYPTSASRRSIGSSRTSAKWSSWCCSSGRTWGIL